MVLFWLLVKLDLENVTDLRIDKDGEIRFYMKWSCNNCQERTPAFVYISPQTTLDNPRGRGQVNFIYKCKFCGRESQADVEKGWEQLSYTDDDSGKFKRVVAFECRGISPEEYEPRQTWRCRSTKTETKVFKEVPIGEDWAEYDDEGDVSLLISGFAAKFERA